MTRLIILPVILLFQFLISCGQAPAEKEKDIEKGKKEKKKEYPKDYFIWPIGAKPEIVANFGEMRPNHYHMGLDGRTPSGENFPIYAAADGYVSKIKIEPFGFGRCIYINHPNGLTTVYAHLNDFFPALEEFVRERQYESESWKIFLEDIPPARFPVKKGSFIARSGNTGGSMGPHLHFEIRDTKTEKVLNPLLFGMPIPDNVPPDILRLAMYDRSKSTYEQTPQTISLKKTGPNYQTSGSVIVTSSDKVSFGITSSDRCSGSSNQNGIFKAVIYDNGKQACQFVLDSITYDETRYLNAHIDYKTKFSGGPYIQHLSKLPGNKDMIYQESAGDGIISLKDTSVHQIRIDVFDANGNKSQLSFALKKNAAVQPEQSVAEGLLFRPENMNIYDNGKISLFLPEGYIYDYFRFTYKEIPKIGITTHQVHTPMVPVHNYFTIKIKPDNDYSDTGKIIMKRSFGADTDYRKAYFEKGWYRSTFREFGNYELIEDKIPPVITASGLQNGMSAGKLKILSFQVKDNCDEIKSFTGLLDGQWLMFSNDKKKAFIYKRDNKWTPGPHELKVIAEDLAGNKTEKTFLFTE